MINGPPLRDGEEIVFDHIPSLAKFKVTAIVMIALTLPVVAVFLYVFPDTMWPVVPLFLTCFLLMQERFRLGGYRAWITNQRIMQQGDNAVDLAEVTAVDIRGNGVRVSVAEHAGKPIKLSYSDDSAALATAIQAARKAII